MKLSDLFDKETIWYHGCFKQFEIFDLAQSGVNAAHLAVKWDDAESYAASKSAAAELDADVEVLQFHFSGKVFDPHSVDMCNELIESLPDTLEFTSNYGWGWMYGPRTLKKIDALDALRGVGDAYTGLNEDTKSSIREGTKQFIREGQACFVIDYDQTTDTVSYFEGHAWQRRNAELSKHQSIVSIYGDDHWQTKQSEIQLKYFLKNQKPHSTQLSPPREKRQDTWELLESLELRPYLLALGYDATKAIEGKADTLIVFNADALRRTEHPMFNDPSSSQSGTYVGRVSGNDLYMQEGINGGLIKGFNEKGIESFSLTEQQLKRKLLNNDKSNYLNELSSYCESLPASKLNKYSDLLGALSCLESLQLRSAFTM